MRTPAANRFTVFALVVIALTGLAAVAWLSKPVTVPAGPQAAVFRTVAVSTGLRACPSPSAPGGRGAGLAVLAAAGGSGPGQAAVTRLSAAGRAARPLRSLTRPGALSLASVPAAAATSPAGHGVAAKGGKATAAARPDGVMVRATGSMAQGLEAEQTSGGVATARCGSPGTDFWFAVPGQQSAGTIELDLMNVDSQASVVDVDVFTDTGPLPAGADTGITVPAHGLAVQSVARLAHGSRAVALHVRTSAGRVVAALRESTRPSRAGGWLPPAPPPSRRQVIPGLPGSKGTRALYVANPGTHDAQVKLSMVSPGGTYQPTGAGAIDVPAGSANRIDLASLSGVAGAVLLRSSVPVTAALTVPGGPGGAPSVMTAAAPALQQQGVLADVARRADGTLVLSAPGAAVRVRLTAGVSGLISGGGPAGRAGSPGSTGSSGGAGGSSSAGASGGAASAGGAADAGGGAVTRLVSVKARHSVTVRLAAPRGAHWGPGFAVVLTPLPGSGPLYAGGVLARGGTVLTIIPVASALTRVWMPSVRDSLSTAPPAS